MTKTFGNRAKQSSGNPSTKTRSRKQAGLVVQGKALPLRVLECRAGNVTARGTEMTHFEWQHLESKETFSTTVFGNVAPEYMETQIADAILPADIDNYELEDLINGGLFATLWFNTKNGTTHINITDVEPLNDYYKEVLEDLIANEQKQQRKEQRQVKSFENEMESADNDADGESDLADDRDNINLDDVDIDDIGDIGYTIDSN